MNVLVIDDLIHSRKDDYDYFIEEFSKSSNFNVKFHYVSFPNEIESILEDNYFDAIICDVVLNEGDGWNEFNLDSVFHILERKKMTSTPVLLVSIKWDSSNIDIINRALSKPQWKGFLQFRDFSKESGNVLYPISQLNGILKRAKNIGELPENVTSNSDIRILHLSDLQYGGFNEDNIHSRTQLAIDEISNYWNQKYPHFILITGDITEHGMPNEYDKAIQWIDYLKNRLHSPVIYSVPGNHDVCVPLGCSARLKFNADKKISLNDALIKENACLINYALTPFRKFMDHYNTVEHLEDNNSSMPWIDDTFRYLGLIFYGINSATPINHDGLPGRTLCSQSLSLITEKIDSIKTSHPKCCTIGLIHHSPIAVADRDFIDNPKDFEMAFKGTGKIKTNILCHGHHHQWGVEPHYFGNYSMLKSQASTFNKAEKARPNDSLRGFNMLTLKRKDNEVIGIKAATCSLDGTSYYCREHNRNKTLFLENQCT